jgi:hypothetical protein
MSVAGVIGFWGRFASRDMEERFREDNLVEDLKLAKFLFGIVIISAVLFVANDWKLYPGTREFMILIGGRVVLLAVTGVTFLRLRQAITPRELDWWLLVWAATVLGLTLHALSTRPPALMNHALSVLLITAASTLVPMRYSFQAGSATLFAMGAMGLFLSRHPDSFTRWGNMTAFTLAVVVGLTTSRKLHRTQRESFAARVIEHETVGKLEAALAEVRKLRGILPICASCKKIRQEDGGWQFLETYISARSEAQFSHGLCPDCKERLYPDLRKQPSSAER